MNDEYDVTPPTEPGYKASFEWKMAWYHNALYAAETKNTFRSKLEDAVPHLSRNYKRGESRHAKNYRPALLNPGHGASRREYPAVENETRKWNFYARTPEERNDE